MVKIISGYSHAAGATVALVNLCNQLNSRGVGCILYGPDNWHLDKCKSGALADFKPEDGDTVLVHHIGLLSLSDLYNLNSIIAETKKDHTLRRLKNLVPGGSASASPRGLKLYLTFPDEGLPGVPVRRALFRKIHFASEAQRNFRNTSHAKFVCPNLLPDLKPSKSKPARTAGVVGSIGPENNVGAAIEMAMRDGMETAILYGYLADPIYFYGEVIPLTKKYPGRIKFAGFMDDQQKMYDSVSDVYSAVAKPWSMTMRECALTGTRYHGPDADVKDGLSNDSIFRIWEDELDLKQAAGKQ
jgi:hypothetical protein